MDLMKRVGLDREESVSLIAENCHVQGELRFSAELIINGRVSGVVTAEASGSGLNGRHERGGGWKSCTRHQSLSAGRSRATYMRLVTSS